MLKHIYIFVIFEAYQNSTATLLRSSVLFAETYLSNTSKMAMNRARANVRLPPEVNRVLYVRNLPYKITSEEM